MAIDNETLLLAMLDIKEQEENPQKAEEAIGRLISLANTPTSPEKSIRKIITKDNQRILAVDMDGTLANTPPHGDGPPPPLSECEPIDNMVEAVQEAAKQGYRIIIFTGRDDEAEIEEWLNHYNVPYESINHREDQPTSSPKVIADRYVDDRAMTPEDFIQNIMGNRQIKRLSSIIRRNAL